MIPYRAKILAIDDTPANLLTLGAALESDYDLQVATSGMAGLELARKQPPDLILLDVMMPEVDGFETFRRIAAEPTLKDIPVIFVTALDNLDSEVAGLQLGAADYITKPIRVVIARQRIHNLLEREYLRKQVQSQRDLLRKLSAAVEQSPASVIVTNLNAEIEYVNPRFTSVTGYAADEVLGMNPRIFASGQTSNSTYVEMWDKLARGLDWNGEMLNRRKNGDIFWEETHIAPIKDGQNKVTHYVAIKTDISTRKSMEEQVRRLAFYDSLTGQPNRRLLDDRLTQTLAANKRGGSYAALMFLDLDNFKKLNDRHGHAHGDALLVEVGRRLSACVRQEDTVARLAGDEFVVLLSKLDRDQAKSAEQAMVVAEKVRASLTAPYGLSTAPNGQEATAVHYHCSASVGLVVFPGDTVSSDILKWADTAMYQAKAAGGNRVQLYIPQLRPDYSR
jgi:diguanylate cyclase (GGDEF)-like protein/PAS domain S-box-containing protein